jgi:hypothetical protein
MMSDRSSSATAPKTVNTIFPLVLPCRSHRCEPPVFGAGHPIGVLSSEGPAAALDVFAQLAQLDFRVLLAFVPC